MLTSFLLLCSLAASNFALDACATPEKYVEALQNFGKLILNPESVLNGTVEPPFADNVVGRVDVTTTFVGRELNIEYYFGTFAESARQNTSTQLIGSAVNISVAELVIQPPMVWSSFIVDFRYRTLNRTFPLQVDNLFRFDKNLLITSYDTTLRRFPELSTLTAPLLAQQIAKELDDTTTKDPITLLAKRAANDTCTEHTQYCTGENQQYDSFDQCYQFLTTEVPFGMPWEAGVNTAWCRYIHKNMLRFRPEIHCPHVGPSGGDMCIERDYNEVVYNAPFTESLVGTEPLCDPNGPASG
ncbi:hypothetical protein VNI00_009060 [Paramarasmius palmivorus]|uniref:Secreted protein n=1 Tax=Paramarasmius palmivorus TaxID=297713 RepID=A0AAW0CTT0_9AGAR